MDNGDVEEFAVGMNVVMGLLESTYNDQESTTQRNSLPGKRPNMKRLHEEVASRLDRKYLKANPIYVPGTFRLRYRVSREI